MRRANALRPQDTLLHLPCERCVLASPFLIVASAFRNQQNLATWMNMPIQLCTDTISCDSNTRIQREIIYRILSGPEGARLRAIATSGDQSNRTARAISWIRDNYAKPVRVDDLAQIAGMGVSTLHHHFRVLTHMSPLQYQKQLRLQAARGRMLVDGMDASTVAFEVGYESVSQFNREYSRFFGQPPRRDIQALREGKVVEISAA